MSINDNVLDDINPDVNLNDPDITPPIESKIPSKEVTIIPTNNEVKNITDDDITKLDNVEKDTLVDKDIEFEIFEDDNSKIVDLKEVEDQLLATETIDRNIAVRIDEITGKFFNSTLTKEHFSSSPSQVNYKYALKFISNECSTLMCINRSRLGESISRLLKTKEEIKDFCSNNTCPSHSPTEFVKICNIIREILNYLKSSKDAVLRVNEELCHILDLDLAYDTLKPSTMISASEEDKKEVLAIFNRFVTLSHQGYPFILRYIPGGNVDEPIGVSPKINSLRRFFSAFNDDLIEFYNKYPKYAIERIDNSINSLSNYEPDSRMESKFYDITQTLDDVKMPMILEEELLKDDWNAIKDVIMKHF
jgi:hypothetical protein